MEDYKGYMLLSKKLYSRNAPDGRDGWQVVRLTPSGSEWDHFFSPFASLDIAKQAIDEVVLTLEGM